MSDVSPEVKAFFAEIGRKNGKKLYKERGSQYFKDIAAKRKRFGRQKAVKPVETDQPSKDKEAT